MTKNKKRRYQVVVFVTDWCPHCQHMKEHTWTEPIVVDAIKPYHNSQPAFVVCSKPQNRHFVIEFDLDRYPTVVIMDEDHNIEKEANNLSPEELVRFLEEF